MYFWTINYEPASIHYSIVRKPEVTEWRPDIFELLTWNRFTFQFLVSVYNLLMNILRKELSLKLKL